MTKNKLILTAMLLSFLTISVYGQKKTWLRYTPAQANAVGKKFMKYEKKDGSATISGEVNPNKLSTTDQVSEDKHKEEFQKSLTISLKGFLGKKASVGDIEATGLVVTQIDTLRYCRPGKFVFAGIKANTVKITLKKEGSSTIKPKDLLKEVEQYANSLNPALVAGVSVIDSIHWESQKSMSIEIKNPSVYYMVQVAELKENLGTPDKYFIDLVRLENGNLTLNENYPVTDTKVKPVISRSFRDGIESIEVELVYKKQDANSKPELIVRYTQQGGGGTKEKIIPMLSATRWDENKFLVHDYVIDEKRTKPVYLNIKAELNGNDIKITRATFTYPEKEIKILKY
jgi:hypothetical protein